MPCLMQAAHNSTLQSHLMACSMKIKCSGNMSNDPTTARSTCIKGLASYAGPHLVYMPCKQEAGPPTDHPQHQEQPIADARHVACNVGMRLLEDAVSTCCTLHITLQSGQLSSTTTCDSIWLKNALKKNDVCMKPCMSDLCTQQLTILGRIDSTQVV